MSQEFLLERIARKTKLTSVKSLKMIIVKLTEPSKLRNEIEITDVIQNMIDGGEKIKPALFRGDYLNITYPEDLQKAESLLRKI